MIRITTAITIFLTIMTLTFLMAVANYEQISPVPVEEIPPEQSHYAVFYTVCGVLQHILITTQPPLRHSMAMRPSQELLDLLKATPIERIIELIYAGPECFYSERPAPEKLIL